MAINDGYLRDPSIAPPVPGLVFLSRFTLDEYAAVIAAAASSPQLSFWIDMLRVNGAIDVAGATAQAAKAYLVGGGLLTQARGDAVFAA